MTKDLFDPNAPFDASVEALRKAIAGCVKEHALGNPAHLALDQDRQIEAVMIALSVSLAGGIRCLIQPAGIRDAIEAIRAYLPQAFEIAEDILRNGAEAHH